MTLLSGPRNEVTAINTDEAGWPGSLMTGPLAVGATPTLML